MECIYFFPIPPVYDRQPVHVLWMNVYLNEEWMLKTRKHHSYFGISIKIFLAISSTKC